MTDSYVGLPTDGSGKKVDTAEIAVGSNTVERQRIVIADNADPAAIAPVSMQGLLVDMREQHEIQLAILASLRAISMQLALISGVHLTDDPLATFN